MSVVLLDLEHDLLGRAFYFVSLALWPIYRCVILRGSASSSYWRTLSGEQFKSLHHYFGPRLYRFFAPLTTAATLGLWITTIVVATTYLYVASALAAGVLATYFVYFQRANAGFAGGQMNAEQIAVELKHWERWHWFRVSLGMATFAICLLGLNRYALC